MDSRTAAIRQYQTESLCRIGVARNVVPILRHSKLWLLSSSVSSFRFAGCETLQVYSASKRVRELKIEMAAHNVIHISIFSRDFLWRRYRIGYVKATEPIFHLGIFHRDGFCLWDAVYIVCPCRYNINFSRYNIKQSYNFINDSLFFSWKVDTYF